MPETPDFDQIARQVVPLCLGVKYAEDVKKACDLVAEQLRLVWNARGAADIAKMEAYLLALFERVTPAAESSTPLITQLDRALRTLDVYETGAGTWTVPDGVEPLPHNKVDR